MKKYTVLLTAVLYLAGIAAYAQSLGDFAREEQKRREAITSEKIIILESAPPKDEPEKEAPIADEDTDAEELDEYEGEGSEYIDENEEADANEATDLYGKTESYWRNTMSEARNMLKRLEDESKELTSARNALQLRHDSTNGSRRGPIKNEIDKARQAQELNKKNLEQAREKLQSLRDDARRSGALPGWVD